MAALVVSPVFAQSLPMELSSTVLNSFDSGGCKTTAATPCSESYEYAANPGNLTDVTASPTTYSVSDTFNQSGSLSTLSDFGSSVYTPETSPHCTAGAPGNCLNSSPFQTWNFQDNYEFQTPGSGPQLQGAVLSFSLPGNMTGLSDLEARVIAVPTGTDAGSQVSVSVVTIIDGWQTLTQEGSLNIYTASLMSTALAGNTDYFLQVRGEAASSAGYTGTLTFTPVPLPANLALLISGLAGLGLLRLARPGLL
jgi:hypothetical protein